MHNRKRILIFSLVYYPNFIGGAEVAIKEITDRLGSDFEFDMVTLRLDRNLPKVERIGNVTVYRVGWTLRRKIQVSSDSLPKILHLNKYAMLFTAFIKGVGLYRKHDYDILWSIMATYNSFAALFLKLVFPKIKFLLTLQEGDPISFIKRRARPLWPLFKMIFKKADCIQAISKYLADFSVDMGSQCPVVVVPNAVDIERFTKEISLEDLEKAKKDIRKKEGDIVLITTSRLVTKNAIEDVISALQFLPEHIKFAIAGRGYLKESLELKARLLGVENRIVWLGQVSHNDMPAILKASDIFIRTPISEGFGNSYVEAMAVGLPCVATPVGGILDFIKDGETGVFAEVRNPESIADAVMRLVRDSELVSSIKRNSFEMVKQKYDWEIIAKEMRNIFKNLEK